MTLPNGWKKVKLEEIADVFDGTHQTPDYVDEGVPFVSVENIEDIWNTNKFITKEAFDAYPEKPQKNDILMTRITAGIIGKTAIVDRNDPLAYYVSLALIRCKKDVVFPNYMSLYIEGPYFKKELNKRIIHTAFPKKINLGDIGKCLVEFPSIEEQKKIAATLSVWDSAIEKMEKLIEAKSEQKKTLTYKLIENQNDVKFKLGNIPIDKSKWKKKKFKDVFEFLSTNTCSRELMSTDEGSIKNIHYGDVLVKYAELLDVNSARIPFLKSSVDSSKMTFLQSGDIVIADTAEDETVGKAVEILNIEDHLVVSGLHTMLCRPQKEIFYHGWLGYYINSKEFHRQLIPLITGIKVSSIAKKDIVDTFILIPSHQEQKIIVETLSEANRELSFLEQQLDNYKKQKQGLMQKLLTGQWRVK